MLAHPNILWAGCTAVWSLDLKTRPNSHTPKLPQGMRVLGLCQKLEKSLMTPEESEGKSQRLELETVDLQMRVQEKEQPSIEREDHQGTVVLAKIIK